jgi:hypothetical protein
MTLRKRRMMIIMTRAFAEVVDHLAQCVTGLVQGNLVKATDGIY